MKDRHGSFEGWCACNRGGTALLCVVPARLFLSFVLGVVLAAVSTCVITFSSCCFDPPNRRHAHASPLSPPPAKVWSVARAKTPVTQPRMDGEVPTSTPKGQPHAALMGRRGARGVGRGKGERDGDASSAHLARTTSPPHPAAPLSAPAARAVPRFPRWEQPV
jgi:hypothetical protein